MNILNNQLAVIYFVLYAVLNNLPLRAAWLILCHHLLVISDVVCVFAAGCYASPAYAIMRCMSRRLFVCVSVTFVHSVKMNKYIFKIFFTIR